MSGQSDLGPAKSPCVHVCILDDDDICTGCFRSGMEISQWGRMAPVQQHAVLERCKERELASSNYFIVHTKSS